MEYELVLICCGCLFLQNKDFLVIGNVTTEASWLISVVCLRITIKIITIQPSGYVYISYYIDTEKYHESVTMF